MSNYQLVPWKQLLSSQVNGEIIPPSTITFDYLHATDGKIIDGMMKLLSLFVTSEANTSEEIKANVINHMKTQPEEYTSAMIEIWKSMVLRVKSWKNIDKTSAKAISYCDSFITSFTQKAIEYKHLEDDDMIIHYISICENKFEEIKRKNKPEDIHENIEFMAKCYEFEASVYIILCIMIINPNCIPTYYNDVRNILENYFKNGITIQSEGDGICAVLSVRYVRGMLRCNLTEDEGYRHAFHENIPKGLENELHEEINDYVDLLYAYAVLMKYKLFNNLDVRIPLYHILDYIWFDSSNEKVIRVKLPYIASNQIFIPTLGEASTSSDDEQFDDEQSDDEQFDVEISISKRQSEYEKLQEENSAKISLLEKKLKSLSRSYDIRKKEIRKENMEYRTDKENEMDELVNLNKEKKNRLDTLRNEGNDDEAKKLENEINTNIQAIKTLEEEIDKIVKEGNDKLRNVNKERINEETNIKYQINLLKNEPLLLKFKEDLKSAEEIELSRDYEQELIQRITIHRNSIKKEYEDNVGYRCLSSVIFRRYEINNRIRILDSNTEFLLYLSYFQSMLTLNDRNKLSYNSSGYSFFNSIGTCLNPMIFNLEDSNNIINELADAIYNSSAQDIAGPVPDFNNMGIAPSDDFTVCKEVAYRFDNKKIDEGLYNIMNERIMGKQGFSMNDICKYYVLHSEGDSIKQFLNIVRTINKHEKFGIEDFKEAYLFKLHHETIKRINNADTSKSSIPMWCSVNCIIIPRNEHPYYKFETFYPHAYAKELFDGKITIYDPNLKFATCSDMSITDVILPYVDETLDLYPYYTERIQFYGGNECDDDKMLTILFGFMLIITLIVVIVLIVDYIRQKANKNVVYNTNILTNIHKLKL